MFITTALDNSQKLNRSALKKQKYNLIKEIRNNYKVEEFFGTKIKNYKELASLYTLIEGTHSDNTTNTQQLIDNKITLLEFLTKQETSKPTDELMNEFSNYDKPILAADLPYAYEAASGSRFVDFFNPNCSKELARKMELLISGDFSFLNECNQKKIEDPFFQSWEKLLGFLLN